LPPYFLMSDGTSFDSMQPCQINAHIDHG
jgi:hypothetical protein